MNLDRLSHHDVMLFFLSLGVLLGVAKGFGEVMTRFNQPAVLGELLAGVLLGPTVLGSIFPDLNDFFFPNHGARAFAMDGFLTLCITLFMIVAGLEVDLGSLWRQGRAALYVSFAGSAIPFAFGLGAAWFFPAAMGRDPSADHLVFALFMATALSITAMPVIAKTLMDLGLYKSDMGVLVMAAATFNDLVGWLVFSVILGMLGKGAPSSGPWGMILATLALIAVLLTAGRWAARRAVPWIMAHTRWPGGLIAALISFGMLGAALTEWIGIKALFGAFLFSLTFSDAPHFREQARSLVDQFISSIFAPIFFASVGLRVNFLAHFDPALCFWVMLIACAGKILGCGLAAKFGGVERREAWAVGFSMNARGIMEIILGLVALQNGLITDKVFVALTLMALATSMMVGPVVQRILRRRKAIHFPDFIKGKAFAPGLRARTSGEAVEELAAALGPLVGLRPEAIARAVLDRENIAATGLGGGLALPHARLDGLTAPAVAVGLSREGVDFDSPDGMPARLILLVLTPRHDDGAQLELMSSVSKIFKKPGVMAEALRAASPTEFLAALKS